MFEEVIWLLLFGSLPTQEQYAKFRKLLEHHRELPQGFADDMILNSLPQPDEQDGAKRVSHVQL